MPRNINIDFLCTEANPALRLPVTGGTTILHAEITVEAGEDPPGGIVPFFALRGNNAGRRNKPKRPLLFSLTQGEREQIKIEAEGDVMQGGFDLLSPGTHRLIIDWSAPSGACAVNSRDGGVVRATGPVSSPLMDGMLIIGGDPGKTADYIPPYGWRIRGTITVDGDIAAPPYDEPEPARPVEPPFPTIPVPTPLPPAPVEPARPTAIPPTPTGSAGSSASINLARLPELLRLAADLIEGQQADGGKVGIEEIALRLLLPRLAQSGKLSPTIAAFLPLLLQEIERR